MAENVSTELSHHVHKRQVYFHEVESKQTHNKAILKLLVAVDEQLTTSRRVVLELDVFFYSKFPNK